MNAGVDTRVDAGMSAGVDAGADAGVDAVDAAERTLPGEEQPEAWEAYSSSELSDRVISSSLAPLTAEEMGEDWAAERGSSSLSPVSLSVGTKPRHHEASVVRLTLILSAMVASAFALVAARAAIAGALRARSRRGFKRAPARESAADFLEEMQPAASCSPAVAARPAPLPGHKGQGLNSAAVVAIGASLAEQGESRERLRESMESADGDGAAEADHVQEQDADAVEI